jgi:ornithine cyclodeaminase/alanine dehydrogenase-like protein (mu-crystallin family)
MTLHLFLAIMDGTRVSVMRTGCIPGVGAKYLAGKNSEIVGIVGTGVINRACLKSIACVLKSIREVKAYDLISGRSEALCDEMKKNLCLDIHPVNNLEEAIRGSDVVSLATSGPNPLDIKTKWL